MSWAKKMRN
jgi:hypothetical protein